MSKATEGTNYTNPTFAYNWAGLKAAGIERAAYHFARPNRTAAAAEARYFMDAVESRGLEPGDILALDLEEESGSLSDAPDVAGWALSWLQEVERLAGFPPILYVSPSVISEYGLTDPAFARYPLWLASWGSAFPVCPAPWDAQEIGILLWQCADDWSVPGINGPVDGDRFVLPISEWGRFGKPAAEPIPEPVPVPAEFVYVFGFADLAARLGADVVGQPVENERPLGADGAIQFTTRGVMLWSAASNTTRFLPAA